MICYVDGVLWAVLAWVAEVEISTPNRERQGQVTVERRENMGYGENVFIILYEIVSLWETWAISLVCASRPGVRFGTALLVNVLLPGRGVFGRQLGNNAEM